MNINSPQIAEEGNEIVKYPKNWDINSFLQKYPQAEQKLQELQTRISKIKEVLVLLPSNLRLPDEIFYITIAEVSENNFIISCNLLGSLNITESGIQYDFEKLFKFLKTYMKLINIQENASCTKHIITIKEKDLLNRVSGLARQILSEYSVSQCSSPKDVIDLLNTHINSDKYDTSEFEQENGDRLSNLSRQSDKLDKKHKQEERFELLVKQAISDIDKLSDLPITNTGTKYYTSLFEHLRFNDKDATDLGNKLGNTHLPEDYSYSKESFTEDNLSFTYQCTAPMKERMTLPAVITIKPRKITILKRRIRIGIFSLIGGGALFAGSHFTDSNTNQPQEEAGVLHYTDLDNERLFEEQFRPILQDAFDKTLSRYYRVKFSTDMTAESEFFDQFFEDLKTETYNRFSGVISIDIRDLNVIKELDHYKIEYECTIYTTEEHSLDVTFGGNVFYYEVDFSTRYLVHNQLLTNKDERINILNKIDSLFGKSVSQIRKKWHNKQFETESQKNTLEDLIYDLEDVIDKLNDVWGDEEVPLNLGVPHKMEVVDDNNGSITIILRYKTIINSSEYNGVFELMLKYEQTDDGKYKRLTFPKSEDEILMEKTEQVLTYNIESDIKHMAILMEAGNLLNQPDQLKESMLLSHVMSSIKRSKLPYGVSVINIDISIDHSSNKAVSELGAFGEYSLPLDSQTLFPQTAFAHKIPGIVNNRVKMVPATITLDIQLGAHKDIEQTTITLMVAWENG